MRIKWILDGEVAFQPVACTVARSLHEEKTAVVSVCYQGVAPQHIVNGIRNQRRHVIVRSVAVVGEYRVRKVQHWHRWLAHEEEAELADT